jgi:hypothetical protein
LSDEEDMPPAGGGKPADDPAMAYGQAYIRGRDKMENLRRYLNSIPSGQIQDASTLEGLLAPCWDKFTGDSEGMVGSKLKKRMEEVRWKPPILTFCIERHRKIAWGSIQAEVQYWELDVDQRTRSLTDEKIRLIEPRQPPLDVIPLAKKIARLIKANEPDDWLKWLGEGEVQVLIRKILPKDSAKKRTLKGRRTRFWTALENCLGTEWVRPSTLSQTYTQQTSGDE